MTTERWREWGLSFEEWRECVEAAEELALLSPPGERTASADEIGAQLAVAKAAEELPPLDKVPARTVPIGAR